MKTNQCVGCGRLNGLRAPMACPCWQSVNAGAVIPLRVRRLRSRVLAALTASSRASKNSEVAAAEVLCRAVNRALRAEVSR